MFSGVFTALITPFRDDKIDYDGLGKILEMQIQAGVDGVVPMGTTGESPTVSFEEHKEFIKRVVKIVNKRAKVVAGSFSCHISVPLSSVLSFSCIWSLASVSEIVSQ